MPKIYEDTHVSKVIEAVEALGEGDKTFTIAEIHTLADGHYKSVGVLLSKLTNRGILDRAGRGIYKIANSKLIDTYYHLSPKPVSPTVPDTQAPPPKLPEDYLIDTKPLYINGQKELTIPNGDLEEAKKNILWVFETYNPWLEQLARDQTAFINKLGEKASRAKVIHQDRLYET